MKDFLLSHMKERKGKLIVIDAIDGAGKSTAISGMAKFFEEEGIAPHLDIVQFQKEHGRLPELSEMKKAKLLLTAEPTHTWIGAAIREEIICEYEDRAYSGLSAAHAFALDREILYKRVVSPFLSANPDGFVIQDRGLISSLAYQPLQDPSLTLGELLALPGNKTELSHAPDIIFLLTLDVDTAQKRLSERTDKHDKSYFEKKDFQSKLAKRYALEEIRQPFLKQGTKIIEVDASKNPEATLKQIQEHIAPLL